MANLPDLVIDQIFRLITTKAAVRMSFKSKQWEDVLFSLPVLDFHEDDHDDPIQHKSFIKILQHYLQLIQKDRVANRTTPFVKLRLCMTRYSSTDACVVSELLSIARSVKELDLSLGGATTVESYYYLCPLSFINAKTLTTLNLEYVKVKRRIYKPWDPDFADSPCLGLLPCLKTMSLKNVEFDRNALLFLLRDCPSIEHLTVESCSFDSMGPWFYLDSPSLKSLEIKHYKASKVEIDVENLESLTLVSSELKVVSLELCLELKHVNISAECLEELTIHTECQRDVSVVYVVDAPALQSIRYIGCLGSKLSLNYLCLRDALIEPLGQRKHFPELKDLLQHFVSSKRMSLFCEDFEDFIFPQEFRDTLTSPILLNLELLRFGFPNGPTCLEEEEVLNDSMLWMAPNAQPGYVEYWR